MEFKKGDSVFHPASQTYFVVSSRRKNRSTGVVALLGGKTPVPESECIPGEREALDPEWSLPTMLSMITEADAAEYPAILEMLGTLTPQQKAQVWVNLPIELQNALKAAAPRPIQRGDRINVYQFMALKDFSHEAKLAHVRNPWQYVEPHTKLRMFPGWDIFALEVRQSHVRIASPEFQGNLRYDGFWIPLRNCEHLDSEHDLSWATPPVEVAAKPVKLKQAEAVTVQAVLI